MDKKMYNTTKSVLLSIDIPKHTTTYKPVSNKQLIDLTLEGIDKAGFKVKQELYSSARFGQQANARFVIDNVADSEMGLMVGWQNSYDKSLSLKFAIGTNVFICSNGCVRGDFGTFKKKHVGEIQRFAPEKIAEYISSAGDIFYTMTKDRERMKEVEITKRVTAELLGRLYIEENIITSTQLNIIKGQIENPAHQYGGAGDINAWKLLNHITYGLKESHPSSWFSQHTDAYNFISNTLLPGENIVDTEIIEFV